MTAGEGMSSYCAVHLHMFNRSVLRKSTPHQQLALVCRSQPYPKRQNQVWALQPITEYQKHYHLPRCLKWGGQKLYLWSHRSPVVGHLVGHPAAGKTITNSGWEPQLALGPASSRQRSHCRGLPLEPPVIGRRVKPCLKTVQALEAFQSKHLAVFTQTDRINGLLGLFEPEPVWVGLMWVLAQYLIATGTKMWFRASQPAGVRAECSWFAGILR